jgi:hypothetical protein
MTDDLIVYMDMIIPPKDTFELLQHTVGHVEGTVGHGGKAFVMGNNHKGLIQRIT